MILCVTLNPCLDKTLVVPSWTPGDSVRGLRSEALVGGKGVNVARALRRLGHNEVLPITFLGGAVGAECELLLRDVERFDPIIIPCESPTRVILTARTETTNEQSAFFDPDPLIQPSEADELTERVANLLRTSRIRALTLSGSSPSEATHALYGELIGLARTREIPVFLDTYGPALRAIWGFWPNWLQLNRREATGYLAKPQLTDDDVESLLDRWTKQGVSGCAVTDGARPVLARWHGQSYRLHPPRVDTVNPVGSGDSFLAGLVDAVVTGMTDENALRRAAAAGASNAMVWEAGAVDPDRVQALVSEIRLERL
jgi:1-phosphofructokinase family hexose kinase